MGIIVISAYKPKANKEQELIEVVKAHVPILRSLGMATEREVIAMQAKDGTILEVFEWVSAKAIEDAHKHPDVHKMWGEFEKCCEYVKLNSLSETDGLFAEFIPIKAV